MFNIVIDTNVIITGFRSNQGSSFRLLSLIDSDYFTIHLSVPLVLEYEEVLLRELKNLPLNQTEVTELIDYYCLIGKHHSIYFLWRPYLRDEKDDMLLELAVKAKCDYIVTYNLRDFRGIEKFNIKAISPPEFLQLIGIIK